MPEASTTQVTETTTAIKPVVTDIANDVTIALKLLNDYKTKGKSALIEDAPQVIQSVKQTVTDVEAALPTIKAGYKTTEFWLIILFFGWNAYVVATGKPLPIVDDITVGTLITTYMSFRHIQKTQ